MTRIPVSTIKECSPQGESHMKRTSMLVEKKGDQFGDGLQQLVLFLKSYALLENSIIRQR